MSTILRFERSAKGYAMFDLILGVAFYALFLVIAFDVYKSKKRRWGENK